MGTAHIGSVIGQEDSFRLLDMFYSAGGNFFDTAINYANWIPSAEKSVNEKTIGRWVKSRGLFGKAVIATKGGTLDPQTRRAQLAPKELSAQIEQSLENLQADVIDLYYLHRDDPEIPVYEILDVLFLHVERGNIRYLGCSNWSAERIREANRYAASCGKQGFVATSDRWSLAKHNPGSDNTMTDMDENRFRLCMETGIAEIPYQAMAGGYLSRLAKGEDVDNMLPAYGLDENRILAKRAAEIAREENTSVAAVSLAYLCNQPILTIPITFFKSQGQLDEIISGTQLSLTKEQLEYLTL